MRSTRRDALKAIGVTATVAGLVSVPTLAQAAGRPKPQGKRKAKPDEARWMGDLDGHRFAGCLVHEVSAVKHGSVAVTLSDSAGAFFVVDILRHDAATPGVARAGFARGLHEDRGSRRAYEGRARARGDGPRGRAPPSCRGGACLAGAVHAERARGGPAFGWKPTSTR